MKLPENATTPRQSSSASEREELINLLQKKEAIIEEQQKRIAILEEYLRLERHRRLGASSEKNTAQGELFDEAEQLNEQAKTECETPPLDKPNKKRGRKGLSPAIPREQIYLTLPDEEKVGAIDTFFVKVKEELDIIPAKVRVLEYLQEKAVFGGDPNAPRQIKSARLPQHPLPKSVASTGMLAYIIVAKYMDALPLYRLEGIFHRYGGSITRTTMANWLIKLARPLQPLLNLLRDHQYGLHHLNGTRHNLSQPYH